MAVQIGDKVRFLNDIGGGTVVRIKDNMAFVADDDGFETPTLLRECVVVVPASQNSPAPASSHSTHTSYPKDTSPTPTVSEPQLKIEETAEGDTPNVTLAFEAHDLKQLSKTNFDAVLVNDSNYFLSFLFLTKASEADAKWQLRHTGVIEPNFQLVIATLDTMDLTEIDRFAVQFIAYKQGKSFEPLPPMNYESRFEAAKFARLHCFHQNVYFDEPVIAYEIMKDGIPQRGAYAVEVPPEKGAKPSATERKPKAKPVTRRNLSVKAQKHNDAEVVDLHIQELLDNFSGLSNAEILNYQVDAFRKIMDENLKSYGKRLVFIHGKGEGVLRQAILKELNYRYKQCAVQDASFREFGYGATQVTIAKDNTPKP